MLAWHSSDDVLVNFGWVVSGDEITFAKRTDLLTYVEIEAATNRGRHLCSNLEGLEEEALKIECTPVHLAAVSYHHGVCCIDRMCTFTCGDLKGVADFETRRICRGVEGRWGNSRRRLCKMCLIFIGLTGRLMGSRDDLCSYGDMPFRQKPGILVVNSTVICRDRVWQRCYLRGDMSQGSDNEYS